MVNTTLAPNFDDIMISNHGDSDQHFYYAATLDRPDRQMFAYGFTQPSRSHSDNPP